MQAGLGEDFAKARRKTHLARQPLVVRPPGWAFVFQLTIRVIRLGHDHDTLPQDLVLLKELPDDDFVLPGRVGIGRIEGLVSALCKACLSSPLSVRQCVSRGRIQNFDR
jgi:hypothetical protein